MSSIDLADIQGMVRSGYGKQPHSAYLFFTIRPNQEGAARAALASLIERVRHGGHRDDAPRVNLALSHRALLAFGLSDADAGTFPREFRLGMASLDRQKILGDDPEEWHFGAPDKHDPLDVLVLCFAAHAEALSTLVADVESKLCAALDFSHQDTCHRPRDSKEHFGFKDGISNPGVVGLHEKRKPREQDPVATGEFLLGYRNAYGMIPVSPSVAKSSDADDLLADGADDERKDLGKNGTFLVYRKLEENVAAFRSFVKRASRERIGKEDPAAEAWLAARLVGRWQSGVPTQVSSDHDPGDAGDTDANDFLFGGGRDGTKCPIGSHIRRSNPRDALPPGTQASLDVVARHRILRRGRPYGAPAPDPLPEGDDGNRGIIFIALNANIERQFEFIQQTWLNSAKFDSLYDETDPFVGPRDGGCDAMSIQTKAARERVRGLGEFVTMRGGGYFFLPGLRALRFLLEGKKR